MRHFSAKSAFAHAPSTLSHICGLSTFVTAAALIVTAASAAEGCNPPCPKGYVCAFKDANGGNGETVCKKPILVPDCTDPLCGLDNGRKRPGSFQAK
jgi:hypothetical protein